MCAFSESQAKQSLSSKETLRYFSPRSSRSTHRPLWCSLSPAFAEVREALGDFAQRYLEFWEQVDWEREETVNDLHMLFGGVCGLAELQQTLRGKLPSDIPLKLVLDRRPFI